MFIKSNLCQKLRQNNKPKLSQPKNILPSLNVKKLFFGIFITSKNLK